MAAWRSATDRKTPRLRLRSRARRLSRARHPWASSDGDRRLERRHEPRSEKGHGESVWLGWFLHAALMAFIPIAETRRETRRAATWSAHAAALQASLERQAWDGEWYRRAFFDDGEPLGAAASEECRIDSVAQSWAALSGAAARDRTAQAMNAVERELIRRNEGLALLFAPPFDKTALDPGYIKGYPPGIRENGGQYTHAALWSVMAFAALGEGDKAADLFSLLNPIHHSRGHGGRDPGDLNRRARAASGFRTIAERWSGV
jgi:cyclic beta-1,2-glucan synthetase